LLVFLTVFVFTNSLFAAKPEKPARKSTGIEKRIFWNDSKILGTPDPPAPYRLDVAFPKIQFDQPLAMATITGANRFLIAERYGKIYSFNNDKKSSQKDLVLDLDRTVFGVTAHPKFLQNGFIYVTSLVSSREESDPRGSRVSRFKVTNKNTMSADPKSELVLLEWPTGGHNGGCLRFGPDGYLYLATGDGSGIADGRKTGQDLGDFLGSILRINVDSKSKNKPYSIPADNPFINTPGAKPEIYSYGHRQVWKFSFDPPTGQMWAGEVGQDLWEMIYLIQKGGNYGWSVMEGSHPFRPERPKGPTEFIKPIIEHPHSDFRSITGGYVYRGNRLWKLKGTYIYGDYDTGKVWGLRYINWGLNSTNKKVRLHRELYDSTIRLVEFGQDEQGEVYLVDFVSGTIQWLVPAPPANPNAPKFPRKLSETGLFASTKDHTPNSALIPYTVNAPLWSDAAKKDRFLALPGESKLEFEAMTYPQPAPGSFPGWKFPDGSVLVKTFGLEMEVGNPDSLRRLETRILHHERAPGKDDEYGAQIWYGYTYVWNDDQTDAFLLDAKGADRTFNITDTKAPGGKREQTWHFPSRSECTLCHTMAAKYVLGVNTLQLNKDHNYNGTIANQLDTFDHLGLFEKSPTKPPKELPTLVDYRDETQDLNLRARSYLQANCSHCHRKWGGGNAEFQLLATLPLAETGILNVRPGHGLFKMKESRLIVPGKPGQSMIPYRMNKIGLGRMPHVGSNLVDEQGTKLVTDWIRQLNKTNAAK